MSVQAVDSNEESDLERWALTNELFGQTNATVSGVKVNSIVEMLNVSGPVTRAASPADVSDQRAQTFRESLLAATKVSPDTGAAKDLGTGIGRRHTNVSQDAKPSPAKPRSRDALPPSPPPAILQGLAPRQMTMQLPLGGPAVSPNSYTTAASQTLEIARGGFSPIASNISQPVVGKPDSLLSGQARTDSSSPQLVSTLLLAGQPGQTAGRALNAIANTGQQTELSEIPIPLYQGISKLDENVVAPAVSSAPADAVAITVPIADPDAAKAASPIEVTTVAPGILTGASPSAVAAAVPNAVLTAVASAVSIPVASAVLSPTASSVSIPTSTAAPNFVLDTVRKPLPSAVPAVAFVSSAKSVATTAVRAVSVATPSAVLNAASPVLPTPDPNASLNAAPEPSQHDAVNASARGGIGSKSTSVSSSHSDPQPAAHAPGDLTAGLSVVGAIAGPLVAPIQPVGGLLVAALPNIAGVSPLTAGKPAALAAGNGKDGVNNVINEATGLKQHAPSVSDQTSSQTGSQGTASSGDQSQGAFSQQGPNATPAQTNFANHIAAVDHIQNASVVIASQPAPTLAGVAAHTAKAAEAAPPATIALPQAIPVINTAKLIQSMGQSEMRVGMRSNDFGNISISTSATRDLISAQISLEHGELARILATHLPEMQARLGGQAMDVRIDMNGQGTGQGTGTSAGMSNGSADGSHGDRQPRGNAASSQSGSGSAGKGNSIAAAVLPTVSGRLDARLDITV